MQQTTQASNNDDHQPLLPSYSDENSTQPSALVDEFIAGQMPQPQYPSQQTNYNQSEVLTASPYSLPHTTNTYLQVIPIPGQAGLAPTTVDVIRPVPQQSSSRKRRCRVATILAVLLTIIMVVKITILIIVKLQVERA